MPTERLDKRVAHLARMTRTEAARAIRRGRVTVDGHPVREPATHVRDESVALDGAPLHAPPHLALFHKPLGTQSTVGDPHGRTSLADDARELLALGLHPVGRLDADTDGLLPFSAVGALTQHLLHPRHAVEKVYVATVEGTPSADLARILAAGVQTSLGTHTAEVRDMNGDQVTLTVTEGKHRMVRRILANSGFPVVALRRIAFGALTLGDLPPGAWREPTPAERAWADNLL